MHAKSPPPPSSNTCQRTRVANNAVASVDLCDCGMFHLHVGAMSLRLEPAALAAVLETLRAALAHPASAGSQAADDALRTLSGSGRGQA